MRCEAQVGVDLGVDVLRRKGLVAYADIVDKDGEIQVFYEVREGGGLDGCVLFGVEDED